MEMTPDQRLQLQLLYWKAGQSLIAWGLSIADFMRINEITDDRVRKADAGLVEKRRIAKEKYVTDQGDWATYSYVLLPQMP